MTVPELGLCNDDMSKMILSKSDEMLLFLLPPINPEKVHYNFNVWSSKLIQCQSRKHSNKLRRRENLCFENTRLIVLVPGIRNEKLIIKQSVSYSTLPQKHQIFTLTRSASSITTTISIPALWNILVRDSWSLRCSRKWFLQGEEILLWKLTFKSRANYLNSRIDLVCCTLCW